MSVETELNEALADLHEAYLRMVTKQQAAVAKEVVATRLLVTELIGEYAKKDDAISKSRLNSILRDLEDVERKIRTATESALFDVMAESSDQAHEDAFTAFQRAAGLSVEFVLNAKVAESIVLAGMSGTKPTARNIATYLTERTGPDGLRLSDRVWQFAGDQRAAINDVLRLGIIRGDTTAKMVRDIRSAYEIEEWKARRLAITESNVAYRTTIGYVAEQSKFVKALRLIPGFNHSEKCVNVSRQNRHGLGVGIFLPSDTDIYGIHPNCTAYTQFVLNEEEK